MRLLVCISSVPDTTSKIKFTDDSSRFDDSGIQWVINPWDELALTRAIELKEDNTNPVTEVVVITIGTFQTEPTLRKCLAIGADKAVRIDIEPLDAYQTASQLAAYIKNEEFGFIICGIESGDYNEASVGGMLAELLDFVSVSSVSSVRFNKDQPIFQRDVANGKEELSVNGTAVLIVQKGFASVPKIPNMRGIMTARSKPLELIKASSSKSLIKFVNYHSPKEKEAVQMLESSDELVEKLSKEAKLI
ncbi:electron transfer flavoprotein subunit beta/FixA family protein [Carboxylicivirga sp. N1Y90]|uniref:electron transfer flavoprotein subunit beta/FixA family protein n=1 Tax=Carboxylicivirga fragile TaxID=3417571 RepID=UPI003D32FF1F|nr:electron transfer flavoprotein subunit beta/FixA family protein [Marinilabiliaceae bacterium N1Y90]